MTFSRPRPMEPADRNFVVKSWLESFSKSAMAKLISLAGRESAPREVWSANRDYFETWNDLINGLVDRGRTLIVEDDAGLIAGFLVYEPWESSIVVHYVYTRLPHRRMGVARQLVREIPAGPVYYTHRNRGIHKIPPGWQFTIRPLLSVLREAA